MSQSNMGPRINIEFIIECRKASNHFQINKLLFDDCTSAWRIVTPSILVTHSTLSWITNTDPLYTVMEENVWQCCHLENYNKVCKSTYENLKFKLLRFLNIIYESSNNCGGTVLNRPEKEDSTCVSYEFSVL